MTPHATADDLTDWLSPDDEFDPADVARLLERASSVVDRGVFAAYRLDSEGNPADQKVKDALRDATCSQIEFWLHVGETDVDVEGQRGPVSIGSLSLEHLPARLAPRAESALVMAGLRHVVMV